MGRSQLCVPDPLGSLKAGDRLDFTQASVKGEPLPAGSLTINRLKGVEFRHYAFIDFGTDDPSAEEGSDGIVYIDAKMLGVPSSYCEYAIPDGKHVGARVLRKPGTGSPRRKFGIVKGTLLGFTCWWELNIRTEELDKSRRSGWARIAQLEDGTEKLLIRGHAGDPAPLVVISNATVVAGTPPKAMVEKPLLKGLKKDALIAYVIAVNGPLTKEAALKAVSKIQGKPYTVGSNFSYFSNQGMVPQHLSVIKDPETKTTLYYVTGAGMALAAPVIKRLGNTLAESAVV
jgi:hypothetical protein